MRSIIFSKDRAAQLDLLLRSMKRFAPWIKPFVLYTTSNLNFQQGYNECFAIHDVDNWHEEKPFRDEVLKLIECKNKYIQFLTDDDVFINEWTEEMFLSAFGNCDEEKIAGLSLRLHKGITYSYTRNQDNPVPPIINNTWRWRKAQGHWNYPFSVDGDVYRTEHIIKALNTCIFNNPNQLEGAGLSAVSKLFIDLPRFVCYPVPKLINIPWNRVQDTVQNYHEGEDPDTMNDMYLKGYDIKPDNIYHIKSNAFHQPVELEWMEHVQNM